MKKFAVLLMVLALALSAVAALAEEEFTQLDWEPIEPYAQQLDPDGRFFEYDKLGFKVWVPSELVQVDVPDQLEDSDFVDIFTNQDQTHIIIVQFTDWGKGSTFQDIANNVADQLAGASLADINTFNAMLANLKDGVRREVFLGTSADGMFISLTYSDISDAEFEQLANCSIASIQPLDD